MESKIRLAITSWLIVATLMQALDTTIANVALPYMQGSVSASQDEIAWVFTSYLVTSAIMTPPTGFLAARFGIKRVLLVCFTGLTIASMLCGAAQSLPQIVLFRCLQSAFGAPIGPLTQTVLFNINPPERQGRAMSVFSMAIMIASILGPVVGGWLTSDYSWRSVFYINVPLGVLAFIGVLIFLPETKIDSRFKLDWFGFGTLSLAVGALQMLLDRDSEKDWFSSAEITIEAILAGVAVYYFSCTPSRRAGRSSGQRSLRTAISPPAHSSSPVSVLLRSPPFLQELLNEPIVTAGLIMGPRGVGTIISMLVAGRLIGRMDIRLILFTSLLTMGWAFYAMSGWNLDVSNTTSCVVGVGQGLIRVPLSMLSLSTVAPQDRAEASGAYNLARTVGSSVGVAIVNSLFTYNVQVNHA
jgi:DHA2 family multidrug resistance protein